MTDVRRIFDPHRVSVSARPSNGAPRAIGKEGIAARHQLGEFLDAVLQRPLYADDAAIQGRVEAALDTMTQAERVYLEIEMQNRARAVHTFNYDPLG